MCVNSPDWPSWGAWDREGSRVDGEGRLWEQMVKTVALGDLVSWKLEQMQGMEVVESYEFIGERERAREFYISRYSGDDIFN